MGAALQRAAIASQPRYVPQSSGSGLESSGSEFGVRSSKVAFYLPEKISAEFGVRRVRGPQSSGSQSSGSGLAK